MTTAAARAKALRAQAHSLYLKAEEFHADAYALEQEALQVMREPECEGGCDDAKPCSGCAE